MLLTRDTIIAAFVGAFVIWFWTRLVRFIRSRLSLRSIVHAFLAYVDPFSL